VARDPGAARKPNDSAVNCHAGKRWKVDGSRSWCRGDVLALASEDARNQG
jgi:hypothetical protein